MTSNDYSPQPDDSLGLTLSDIVDAVRPHLVRIMLVSLLCGLTALGGTYLVAPRFVARATFLPPQQQSQSAATTALAALGSLAGVGPARTPADQYVALMQSATVADRVIDHFQLMKVYDVKYRAVARRILASNVSIGAGKKDGLISVAVEETSPERAAEMANRYVLELQSMLNKLAITEAQQRRAFFDAQLLLTRDRLTKAQTDLQRSGFNPSTLRLEPKISTEGYIKLRAEVVAAEVKLQALRSRLTDEAPEVQVQSKTLRALQAQLSRDEHSPPTSGDTDYVGKYREFKYQEALFDVYARQFEVARVDESREGALIQVVDPAYPPELKSYPKRARIAIAVCLVALALQVIAITLLQLRRTSATFATTRRLRPQEAAPIGG